MQSTTWRTPAAPADRETVPCTPEAAEAELLADQRPGFSTSSEVLLMADVWVAAEVNLAHSHSLSGSQRLVSFLEVSPTEIAARLSVLAVPELEMDIAADEIVLLFGPLAPL